MDKIQIEHLDIPIIRSCNLSCKGCLTFSDSKQIKGIVRLEDSHDWLRHWSNKLNPRNISVFGGEPLLHPGFVDWCTSLSDYWPKANLRIYTNGYYLSKLDESVLKILFSKKVNPTFVISIQTGHDPYYSDVKNNIEKFKSSVLQVFSSRFPNTNVDWYMWSKDEVSQQEWWKIVLNNKIEIEAGFSVCEQFRIPWQTHYKGFENNIMPCYEYDSNWHNENHNLCQAKNYINLYKGKIYKCPTTAVLEHTLETFNLKKNSTWSPYINKYQPLDVNADDSAIVKWFKRQEAPEQVCNMCGFSGPNNPRKKGLIHQIGSSGHLDSHEPKENWRLPISSL